MPTVAATASAVARLSPVTIHTLIPILSGWRRGGVVQHRIHGILTVNSHQCSNQHTHTLVPNYRELKGAGRVEGTRYGVSLVLRLTLCSTDLWRYVVNKTANATIYTYNHQQTVETKSTTQGISISGGGGCLDLLGGLKKRKCKRTTICRTAWIVNRMWSMTTSPMCIDVRKRPLL